MSEGNSKFLTLSPVNLRCRSRKRHGASQTFSPQKLCMCVSAAAGFISHLNSVDKSAAVQLMVQKDKASSTDNLDLVTDTIRWRWVITAVIADVMLLF